MQDVIPFLRNVTRGRNVPEERLLEVAKHYELFQGVSPINQQNRMIIKALENELASRNCNLPVFWGNRNWHPLLPDTLQEMKARGVKNALAFVSSAYSSYSSCRQYLEDMAKARQTVGEGAPELEKIRPFFNHPLFVEAHLEHLDAVLCDLDSRELQNTQLIFTAHSIPLSMAGSCKYQEQLLRTAQILAESAGIKKENWQLVYQSRSGPPSIPWLEPDILDCIRELKEKGKESLLIHPIGFISDHMEVIYDLDHEARNLCQDLQIRMRRVRGIWTNPKFISMIADLIFERLASDSKRACIEQDTPLPDFCPENCCPAPASRPQICTSTSTNKNGN